MKQINLKAMAVEDLLDLQDRVSRVLAGRVERERRDLESRLARLQSVKLTGVAGIPIRGRGVQKRGGKIPPKYRNSANPSETWTGRGRQPRWLTAAIKTGKKRTDFLIGENGKSHRRRKRRTKAR